MARLSEAEDYARRAIKRLTKFNARIPSGDAYYQLGLILEAEGKTDEHMTTTARLHGSVRAFPRQ